jgi:hypothetical protein
MQANNGQCHEVEPAGIDAPLREASVPNDAAAPETRRVTAPPLAPADQRPSAAPHVPGEAGSTAVIEALVLAALHALEAHVWDVKKRVAIFQESVAEVAERPAVTGDDRGTPLETTQPLCAEPQPVSHAPRRAANPRA